MKFTLAKLALASITMMSARTNAQGLRGEKTVSRKLMRAMDNPARMGRMGMGGKSSVSRTFYPSS